MTAKPRLSVVEPRPDRWPALSSAVPRLSAQIRLETSRLAALEFNPTPATVARALVAIAEARRLMAALEKELSA